MSIVALWWREILIALLLGSCFFSVRACESAHEQVVQIKAEDAALVSQAQHESDEKQANDKRENEDAKRDFEKQISDLAADHRIASVQCVRNKASVSPMSPKAPSTTGTLTEVRAELPRTPVADTFDPGPQLDALTREADIAVAKCGVLVDWIMATR